MSISPSIKNRLETQHETIDRIIATINNKRVELQPDENKWSIKDIIAHLVRYQQVYIERINLTLEEEAPFFPRYIAENDGDFEYWRTNDVQQLLQQLAADRKIINDIIFSLTEEQCNRLAIHKKFGSHTMIQWMEFFLLHEAHHILAIFKLAYDIETN